MKMRLLFGLTVASAVFFACAEKETLEEAPACDSSSVESCEQLGDSSDSGGDGPITGVSSSDNGNPGVSSSSLLPIGDSSSSVDNPDISSSSDGLSSASVSSSSAPPSGANCDYKPEYCKSIPFGDVITTSMNHTSEGFASKDASGNEIPSCVFATVISKMGNESAGLLVNGKELQGVWGPVGGRCGNTDWGQKLCSEAINDDNIQKVDGGYYIWIGKWVGQDFVTTGGTPVCGGSSGGNVSTLTCSGLAATGIAGSAITQPVASCDAVAVSSGINWTGAPASWTNPTANTYNISARATSGNCSGQTASCGSIVVSPAPTTSELTCTGMPQTGTAGTAITPQPTVRCGTTTLQSGFAFTSAPLWSNPTAATYNVGVSASSGTCSGKTASCGTITVSAAPPKLACGSFGTTTVVSGTKVNPPAVTCGTAALTSGLTWTNAPSDWNSPAANGNQARTYSNVSVRATSGNCSGQTAACTGSLTVNPKLVCGELYQSITTSQIPNKPPVSCGGTAITTGITWTPNLNATLAAGTYNNVKAAASCGGSSQTADCSGTTTVTNATTASSSSRASSSSVAGGSSYPTLTAGAQGVKSGWASRYWDGCKPSCGWQANQNQGLGGSPTKTCSKDGTTTLSDNNAKNSCESGGTAYTCFNQAPWVEGNVAYAFAASHTNSDCGRCYQVQFTGGVNSGSSSPQATLDHIKGKTLIVKISNIGGDVGGTQFDLMVPGGGLGLYDSFSGQSGVNGSVITGSERYGGFVTDCQRSNSTLSALQTCLKGKCDAAFTNSSLKSGCYVYADWFGVVNNPAFLTKEITCPSQFNGKW